MGTRHLIAVYQDGVPKIAQYGQWDGYPTGQGRKILAFLHDTYKVYTLETFRLKKCRFLTDVEIDKINQEPDPIASHPQLSRNLGADILDLATAVEGLTLINSIEFAADSLFCEWAYVIDFDTRVFEVYRGFNTTPAIGRFADLPVEPGCEYQPVTLVKSYSLGDLPAFDDFCQELEPETEE